LIAVGDKNRTILDRLKIEETRRDELIRELEYLETFGEVSSLDEVRFKRELKSRLANIRGLLERHGSSARRLLKTLLEHPLRFQAVQEGNRKRYRILGTGSYLPLLPDHLTPLNSTEEMPLPGAWCPQRESRASTPPEPFAKET
jgi:hypothetical protein